MAVNSRLSGMFGGTSTSPFFVSRNHSHWTVDADLLKSANPFVCSFQTISSSDQQVLKKWPSLKDGPQPTAHHVFSLTRPIKSFDDILCTSYSRRSQYVYRAEVRSLRGFTSNSFLLTLLISTIIDSLTTQRMK